MERKANSGGKVYRRKGGQKTIRTKTGCETKLIIIKALTTKGRRDPARRSRRGVATNGNEPIRVAAREKKIWNDRSLLLHKRLFQVKAKVPDISAREKKAQARAGSRKERNRFSCIVLSNEQSP